MPAKTIVNQLTIARNPATAPSSPPSPNDHVESFREPLLANPRPAPPTRMMCGIARKNRKNVVSRLRFSINGSTVTDTGYVMRRDYTEERQPATGNLASSLLICGALFADRILAIRFTRFPKENRFE